MNLNKLSKAKKITLILIFAILPFGLMKTDYYFMSPGPPYQWDIEIDGQVTLNDKMGFITTVNDARKSLENIFKNNIDKPNNP